MFCFCRPACLNKFSVFWRLILDLFFPVVIPDCLKKKHMFAGSLMCPTCTMLLCPEVTNCVSTQQCTTCPVWETLVNIQLFDEISGHLKVSFQATGTLKSTIYMSVISFWVPQSGPAEHSWMMGNKRLLFVSKISDWLSLDKLPPDLTLLVACTLQLHWEQISNNRIGLSLCNVEIWRIANLIIGPADSWILPNIYSVL